MHGVAPSHFQVGDSGALRLFRVQWNFMILPLQPVVQLIRIPWRTWPAGLALGIDGEQSGWRSAEVRDHPVTAAGSRCPEGARARIADSLHIPAHADSTIIEQLSEISPIGENMSQVKFVEMPPIPM